MYHLEGRTLIVDQLYIGCSGSEKATGQSSEALQMNTDKGNAMETLWQEHARQASRKAKRRQAATLQDGLAVDARCERERFRLRLAASKRRPAEAGRYKVKILA
jgi:hypothetical protein